jgi:hypothetical protein
MELATQLSEVVRLLERLGIEVRNERLGGSGGSLCHLRGRPVVFVDLDADLATRLERCVAALATIPDAESLYLSPQLRERIETRRAETE